MLDAPYPLQIDENLLGREPVLSALLILDGIALLWLMAIMHDKATEGRHTAKLKLGALAAWRKAVGGFFDSGITPLTDVKAPVAHDIDGGLDRGDIRLTGRLKGATEGASHLLTRVLRPIATRRRCWLALADAPRRTCDLCVLVKVEMLREGEAMLDYATGDHWMAIGSSAAILVDGTRRLCDTLFGAIHRSMTARLQRRLKTARTAFKAHRSSRAPGFSDSHAGALSSTASQMMPPRSPKVQPAGPAHRAKAVMPQGKAHP